MIVKVVKTTRKKVLGTLIVIMAFIVAAIMFFFS